MDKNKSVKWVSTTYDRDPKSNILTIKVILKNGTWWAAKFDPTKAKFFDFCIINEHEDFDLRYWQKRYQFVVAWCPQESEHNQAIKFMMAVSLEILHVVGVLILAICYFVAVAITPQGLLFARMFCLALALLVTAIKTAESSKMKNKGQTIFSVVECVLIVGLMIYLMQ